MLKANSALKGMAQFTRTLPALLITIYAFHLRGGIQPPAGVIRRSWSGHWEELRGLSFSPEKRLG